METLIASLMIMASTFLHLPVPDTPPVLEIMEQKQIAELVCTHPEQCKNLYVFYAHKEGKILLAKGSNLDYTFTHAEVLREIGRHILYKNQIYKESNSCRQNAELEAILVGMEMDYIVDQASNNKYVMNPNGGLPSGEADLGQRIWFCDSEAENKIHI